MENKMRDSARANVTNKACERTVLLLFGHNERTIEEQWKLYIQKKQSVTVNRTISKTVIIQGATKQHWSIA